MTTNALLTTDKSWKTVSMKAIREAKELHLDNNINARLVKLYNTKDAFLQQQNHSGAMAENFTKGSYQKSYLGIYSHFVERIIKLIETHIDDEYYGIEELCRDAGSSRSQLHCKLKALTGLSTSIFIRSIRLHKAKALLMGTDLNITQVAFEVGFSDSRYFSRVFSKMFRQSPKEFREQALAIT